jgi:probable addiction module antidote protein
MARKSRSPSDKRKMLAKFLNDSLAAGDTIAFVRAIGDLIRAQGMTEVSQKTGLNRPALYVSFGGAMMPNIDRVIRTLAVLQLEIVVRPTGQS